MSRELETSQVANRPITITSISAPRRTINNTFILIHVNVNISYKYWVYCSYYPHFYYPLPFFSGGKIETNKNYNFENNYL